MSIPVQCHLWQKDQLTSADLDERGLFEHIKTYSDDGRYLSRHLFRCTKCGQLYFYEFYEMDDWEHGNDPQYATYIPVESVKEADRIAHVSVYDILKLEPRLQSDWPSDAPLPVVRWVGRRNEAKLEQAHRPQERDGGRWSWLRVLRNWLGGRREDGA